ncbi:MAG: FlhC family transcriptional regulator [Desulfobaccales bacterium]
MIVEESQNWHLACSLVNKGMRLPLIHALTGVCLSRLRQRHKDVNGISAPPGRTPKFAHAMIKNKDQALEAAKFISYYHIYNHGNGDRGCGAVNPEVMLESYNIYAKTSMTPLDINLAWYIIRDLEGGQLRSRRCSKCGIIFLYTHENEALQTCPMCA